MINQIEAISQTARRSLRGINKGLNQARRIQARIKTSNTGLLPKAGILWSPLTGLPVPVQISRWIE